MIYVFLFIITFLVAYWIFMMPYFYSSFKGDRLFDHFPTHKKVFYSFIWPAMVVYGAYINSKRF